MKKFVLWWNRLPEIKPCPFCGGRAELRKSSYPHWVVCQSCGAMIHGGVMGEKEGERASIEAWNRRKNNVK